tara:strand:+ start:2576 stop:2752 length:177 start_codon:yes stop_codon:yes gene_type:complete
MWQIVTGFAAGIYVGTYYDCKPTILLVRQMIKDKFPEERKDNKNGKPPKPPIPPKSWF